MQFLFPNLYSEWTVWHTTCWSSNLAKRVEMDGSSTQGMVNMKTKEETHAVVPSVSVV